MSLCCTGWVATPCGEHWWWSNGAEGMKSTLDTWTSGQPANFTWHRGAPAHLPLNVSQQAAARRDVVWDKAELLPMAPARRHVSSSDYYSTSRLLPLARLRHHLNSRASGAVIRLREERKPNVEPCFPDGALP